MLASVVERATPVEDVLRNVTPLRPVITDAVKAGVRSVKRTIRHGRYAADDAIEEAQHQIKHRPFQAIGAAFLVGALAAGFTALLLSRRH
jgi:ElaB/YqjD/DUF883 family membrane-anchored ribosome-binding protein